MLFLVQIFAAVIVGKSVRCERLICELFWGGFVIDQFQ